MGRVLRRQPSRSAGKSRRPGWLLLLLGLGLGALFSYGIQYYLEHSAQSGSGLRALFAGKSEPAGKKPEKPAPPAKTKLDFYTILPEVETVLPEKGAKAAPRPAEPERDIRYVLQAAAFSSHEEADRLKARLALNGLEAHIEKVTIEGKGEYHRVRLGPYRSLPELDAASQQLAQMGIKATRLKVKKAPGA